MVVDEIDFANIDKRNAREELQCDATPLSADVEGG